jgi:hypothetical protein
MDYVHKIIDTLNTPNKIEFKTEKPLDPWYENNLHWNYQAASIATKQVNYSIIFHFYYAFQ